MSALSVLQGRAAGEALRARPAAERPDAVFAANDLLAVGVLQAFSLMSDVRVPEDIALIGYDDIDFASATVVPLSSIRQPAHLIGYTAVDLLLTHLDDPDGDARAHGAIPAGARGAGVERRRAVTNPAIGVMLPRDLPADQVRAFAQETERLGFDELWVVEDLGFGGGIAGAGAVLAWTERLRVGIGILPAGARNAVFAAMELATLARLFPVEWMRGSGMGCPTGCAPPAPGTRGRCEHSRRT